MSNELQRCPNCGAYVMGGDTICPRCDAELHPSAPEADTRDPDGTESLPVLAEDDATALDIDLDALDDAPTLTDVPIPSAGPLPAPSVDPDAPTLDLPAPPVEPDAPTLDVPAPQASVPPITELLPAADAESAPLKADMPPITELLPAAGVEVVPPTGRVPPVTEILPAASAPDTNEAVPEAGPLLDAGEMPTMQMGDLDEAEADTDSVGVDAPAVADTAESAGEADEAMHRTVPATGTPAPEVYTIPPAPYTPPPITSPPPPAMIAPPPAPYAPPGGYYAQGPQVDPAIAYLQQRVSTYRRGGYRVETHGQYEASLRYGKRLTFGTLLLAVVSIIGALWYLVILVVSGFQADTVYVVLENDGRVYEDGPGAAHIRRQRSRIGRRWSVFGLLIFFLSVLLAIPLGLVAGVVMTQDRYQAALREAYPAVTLFEEHFTNVEAAPDDVDLAKNGAVAFAVAGVLTAVGLWGGLTLFVIGTVHASAYRVRVPPLPGWA